MAGSVLHSGRHRHALSGRSLWHRAVPSAAIARTMLVLPHPGAPYSSTPRAGFSPRRKGVGMEARPGEKLVEAWEERGEAGE